MKFLYLILFLALLLNSCDKPQDYTYLKGDWLLMLITRDTQNIYPTPSCPIDFVYQNFENKLVITFSPKDSILTLPGFACCEVKMKFNAFNDSLHLRRYQKPNLISMETEETQNFYSGSYHIKSYDRNNLLELTSENIKLYLMEPIHAGNKRWDLKYDF